MEIYIYETGEDGYLCLKGITDMIRSVTVSKRFFTGDVFKAVFPGTEKNLRLIAQGRIIEVPEVFSGYITKFSAGRDGSGCGIITAEGCSFDGMLSRRVLAAGEASDSFMTVLDKNAGAAAEEMRRFPCTYFDKGNDCGGMLEDGIIYENLGTYVTSAGRHKLFGVGSEIVHEDGGARIRIYGRYGADRSILQEENEAVVLSDSYGNVTDISRSYNENGAVNGAFIYSEEKVNSKGDCTCEEWKKHFGDACGFGRCEEVYRIEPVVEYISVAYGESYIWSPSLDESATAKRAENLFLSRFSEFDDRFRAVLRVKDGCSYGFETGDRITLYSKGLGITVHERVYEIRESFENGAHYAAVYLGSGN